MRHRKAGFKLNRTTAHRQAMLRNMAASLFEHGQITTTIPKARRGDLHARRQVIATLGADRRGFDWLHLPKGASEEETERVGEMRERAESFFDIPASDEVERNRYGELRAAPKLVKHIFENVAPRFADRPGGYTRIIKLGSRRGDAAEMAILEFVGYELPTESKTKTPAPAAPTRSKKKKEEEAPEAEEKTEAKPAAEKKPAKKKAAAKKKKKSEPAEKPAKKKAAPSKKKSKK